MFRETCAHSLYVVDRILFYLMWIELYIDVAVERITENFEVFILYVHLLHLQTLATLYLLLFVKLF